MTGPGDNITGGRFTDFMLGGLNYQIEHHLFPSMPRPNLRRVQGLVRDFCVARQARRRSLSGGAANGFDVVAVGVTHEGVVIER